MKIACQNGNNGTRMNHSSAEVRIAHGTAAMASKTGLRLAVHFPSTPKNTSAQEKIRPLVKGDADCYGPCRWLGGQRPVAGGYGGHGHPVNRGIAPNSRGEKLADDRRKRAADEAEINSRAPTLGAAEFSVRAIPRNQR